MRRATGVPASALPHDVLRATFYAALERYGLVIPVPELRFDLTRRWRFDFAWPAYRVALEVEGGVWTRGRHTRGAGFVKDLEKYNSATSQGWAVLRVTPAQLVTLDTIDLIQRTIKVRQEAA